jgi:hypothetical protein
MIYFSRDYTETSSLNTSTDYSVHLADIAQPVHNLCYLPSSKEHGFAWVSLGTLF